jgi:hypothetical protein
MKIHLSNQFSPGPCAWCLFSVAVVTGELSKTGIKIGLRSQNIKQLKEE